MAAERWNAQATGYARLYSCLWCGAAVAAGSAIRQHEWFHERRGDYADTTLRTEGVGATNLEDK